MAQGQGPSGWQRPGQQAPQPGQQATQPGQQPPPPPPPPPGYSPPPPYTPGGPPAYGPYGPQPQRPTGVNALAIVALVAGIIWIFGLGSLAAIVCGLIALSQIRKTNQSGKGMAIAGLVLGVLGVLGAAAIIIAAVVVEDETDEFGPDFRRELERSFQTVNVRVTADRRICYNITVQGGSTSQAPRSACGSGTFGFGAGGNRTITVAGRPANPPGTISASVTVGGDERARQSSDSLGTITFSL